MCSKCVRDLRISVNYMMPEFLKYNFELLLNVLRLKKLLSLI